MTWLEQIFEANAANGGIVRRSKADVQRLTSLAAVVERAKERGFHVLETGGQIVVLCHEGKVIIHT